MLGHRKNKALLFGTVCIFLLCLLQVACAPNGEVDDPESNSIDPDKFALEVEEIYKNKGADNTITVKITPGSPGMCLGEFFVTASLEYNMGIVRGSSNRGANGFLCESTLDEQRLENLFLINQQSHCLGKEDTHFAQGKKVAFRIKAIPGAAIKKGDTYTLNVKVERKGSHPRTETNSTVLTAKQDRKNPKKQTEATSTSGASLQASEPGPAAPLNSAASNTNPVQVTDPFDSATADSSSSTNASAKQNGVDTKAQTEEASTSDTSAQTPATVLDTVSGNAMQSINQPTLREDLPVPTEEEHALDTNPQIPVSDLPATTNSTPPNTSAAQRTEVSDITEDDSPSSTNASAQQPASHQFTVTLSDATRCDGVRNFVLVTIKPNGGGMALKDFFVTASLSGSKGIAKGSSGPKGNGFVYSNALDKGNLEELFLTNQNSKCLGKDDTRFARGEEVAFRIEVKPGAAVGPGDQYMLTVEVAYTGSNPHTETESILLTATQKSPQKKKKRATPRK